MPYIKISSIWKVCKQYYLMIGSPLISSTILNDNYFGHNHVCKEF